MSSSDLSSDDDDEEPLECDTFDSELLRGPGLRVDLSPSATWTALRFGSVSDTHSSSVSTSSSVSVSPPSEPHSYVKPDASEAETNNDNGQKLQLARQVDVATPRTLKVVCISDTHSLLSRVEIPDGDVLLVAGDMTLRGRHDELVVFDELVGRLPHRHKFCVCGNHEHAHARRHAATKQAMSREKRVARPDDVIRNCRMLRDELVVVDGVMRLWGSGWKSNVRPPADGAHSAVDVLLTHAPPRAYDPNMSSCEEQVIRLCCSAASPSTPSASASASTSTSAPPPEPALESPVMCGSRDAVPEGILPSSCSSTPPTSALPVTGGMPQQQEHKPQPQPQQHPRPPQHPPTPPPNDRVIHIRPLVHVFGHSHTGYGVYRERPPSGTPTTFINAACKIPGRGGGLRRPAIWFLFPPLS